MSDLIPITKPWMGEEEAAAARCTILSGWVTQGPEVAAFERAFADFVGAPYACAVSNCTVSLHLALLAVDVKPGDEVITVSHSFIATANCIRYCGATPVFVDIDPATFNINPALIEQAITSRTRAILCVHQIGMPCDLAAILPIARAHGVPVIEDAACAIGSEIQWNGAWEKIGKPHADIACFSFHPRKLVTTGDGGMLTTREEHWDKQFRLWRQHAMSMSDTLRHTAKQVAFESYPTIGYNYRMTDIQAAVGREQLQRLPAVLERRKYLVNRYQRLLAEIPDLGTPHQPAWARSNWQSYSIRLPDGADQTTVMQAMLDQGISTRRGIMCAHREAAYPPGTWINGPEGLSQSELAQDRCVLLPLYHQMTESDQDRIIDALRTCLSREPASLPALKA